MKFKIGSIAIYFILLSIVPILINGADSQMNDNEIKLENVDSKKTKAEENRLFDLYAEGKIKGEPMGKKLGLGPTYFLGWAKYFHYDNGVKAEKPTEFFQNNAFYDQRVLKENKNKKDEYGPAYIPSKFHFFLKLTRDSLIVLSSRQNKLQRVVDSMQVDLINPIPKDDMYKGGVQKLGEFDEGNCFQVLTTTPDGGAEVEFDIVNDVGVNQNWVICFDKVEARTLLMEQLIQIKLIKQKVRGASLSTKKEKPHAAAFLKPKKTPIFERYNGPDKNKDKDGFWVLLQDWSPCSVKCGGGIQTQQWICQPPFKGGKPCQGKPIRTRPCNPQLCPGVSGTSSGKNTKEVTVKPILKVLPWSSRLQRYLECEVKETDVLFIRRDVPGNVGKPIKYPGRMVMSNRTIALYEDDTFDKNVFTFNLQDSSMGPYIDDYCCLVVEALDKRFRVCGFSGDCGSKINPEFVNNWLKAFNLFQNKCWVDLPKKNWKDSLKNDADDDGGKMKIDMAGLMAREGLIKRKMEEKQQIDIENKIANTQGLALKAVRKELKLERLVRNEEKLKEQSKINDLLRLKYKEEKKKECLVKALKEREAENKKGRTTQEAELEIAKIKNEAKKDVDAERLNLRKKLNNMKKTSQRRQRMIQQQINLIRSSMAKDLLDANKNGDMELCRAGLKAPEKAIEYCNHNFVTNYTANKDCQDMDRFCPICCENEFGNLYLNKRDECYKMCDDMVKKQLKGDWIWAPI